MVYITTTNNNIINNVLLNFKMSSELNLGL